MPGERGLVDYDGNNRRTPLLFCLGCVRLLSCVNKHTRGSLQSVRRDEMNRTVETELRKSGTHITLESPTVVDRKYKDDITARIEGFGQDIEVLRLRRPDALW